MAQETVQAAAAAAADAHNGGSENGNAKAVTVSFTDVKPQLIVHGGKADDAIKFYKTAFGAEELSRVLYTKRKADHELPLILAAELKLGSSVLIISDVPSGADAPAKSDVVSFTLGLETSDVEGAVANAVKADGKAVGEISEVENAFDGDRVGKVTDPYGYVWSIYSGKKVADVEA